MSRLAASADRAVDAPDARRIHPAPRTGTERVNMIADVRDVVSLLSMRPDGPDASPTYVAVTPRSPGPREISHRDRVRSAGAALLAFG